MKIYISGPRTGIKDFNSPEFEKAKAHFINLGHLVESPSEAPRCNTWEDYMKYDIVLLLQCSHIFMLKGWENSKGAKLEKYIADSLGIKEIVI